ncbi:hypothetical protein GCM10027289_29860 [Tsukamurella serpentis]
MTNRDIVYIRGANEPPPAPNGYPAGMLSGVARELDRLAPGQFRHHSTTHASQYANPQSNGDSIAQAKTHANRLLDTLGGGRVVGYSQGAWAAGDVTDARDDVPCGYLLSDPLRPAGANRTGAPGQRRYQPQEQFTGFGIAGQRRIGVARWYSLPDDIITDAYPDNLVRTFADATEFVGFAGLDDAEQLMNDLLGKIKRRAWQNLPWLLRLINNPATVVGLPDVVKRTVDQGLGYPARHCAYGTEKTPSGRTYIQELARDIAIDAGVLRP